MIFHLRDQNEDGRYGQNDPRVFAHESVGRHIHVDRLDRAKMTLSLIDHQHRQETAGENFQTADNNPPRPRPDHRSPPADAIAPGLVRHEAKVVDLLADLNDEREENAGRRPEIEIVEPVRSALSPANAIQWSRTSGSFNRIMTNGVSNRRIQIRLGDQLQPADQRDPQEDDGDDDDGGDEVADSQRQAQVEIKSLGHDRRFEGEEDEGEAGIDQRRYRRAI